MSFLRALGRDVALAAAMLGLAVAVGLGYNWLRGDGLPLFAAEPYQIFVPCPEATDEAGKTDLSALTKKTAGSEAGELSFPAGTLLIDARSSESFGRGHIRGAINVPYDELYGLTAAQKKKVQEAMAARHAARLLVYCDGWENESDPAVRYAHPPSEFLADELKSGRFADVSSLQGGLKGFVERGGRLVTGQ